MSVSSVSVADDPEVVASEVELVSVVSVQEALADAVVIAPVVVAEVPSVVGPQPRVRRVASESRGAQRALITGT